MRTLPALIVALWLAGCTQAFFQPHSYIVSTPGQFGVEYQPVEFEAQDGTALFAWFLPARGEPRATVLYLHGNAENISTHFAKVAWMPAAGYNVLAAEPKELWVIPNAGHIQAVRDKSVRKRLAEFLDRHVSDPIASLSPSS